MHKRAYLCSYPVFCRLLRGKMKKYLAIIMLLPSLVFAQPVSDQTKMEISYLLSYLKESGCQFNRNGSWYSAAEAVDHLHKKYEYLQQKGLVVTTEDFINRAATESSMSGQPYHVKCGTAAEEESGPWLRAVLVQHRAQK